MIHSVSYTCMVLICMRAGGYAELVVMRVAFILIGCSTLIGGFILTGCSTLIDGFILIGCFILTGCLILIGGFSL